MKESILEHYLNMLYVLNLENEYIQAVENIKADGYIVCRNAYGSHRIQKGED